MTHQRLEGWKQIAAFVGRSERWCRKQASTTVPERYRLPVYRIGMDSRAVCADPEALATWLYKARKTNTAR